MPDAISGARQRVLGQALQLFCERGYGGTSLRAISEGLGFTKAALYYHYPAKSDMLEALANPVAVRLEALASAPADVSGPAGRRALLAAYLDVLIEAGSLAAVLMVDPSASEQPAARRCRSARLQLRDMLAEAGAPPFGMVRASCSLGAIQATVIDFPGSQPSHSRPAILAASVRALGDRHPPSVSP